MLLSLAAGKCNHCTSLVCLGPSSELITVIPSRMLFQGLLELTRKGDPPLFLSWLWCSLWSLKYLVLYGSLVVLAIFSLIMVTQNIPPELFHDVFPDLLLYSQIYFFSVFECLLVFLGSSCSRSPQVQFYSDAFYPYYLSSQNDFGRYHLVAGPAISMWVSGSAFQPWIPRMELKLFSLLLRYEGMGILGNFFHVLIIVLLILKD